ncbi:hypothetical protein Ddye_030571 [Dipteronia dyeriana]|uniref:protein-serine/threonine phosphatase n=1 Tax=Dipteronia dyeriana TaxID=168575 RepID=A0AAD9THN7_9ROSI|nr:hypothetical protein Ddye_030571 [Dipteronia dyeriana]
MPCAVAVPNSPIFSPSTRISSLFGKPSSSSSLSPRIHGTPPPPPPQSLASTLSTSSQSSSLSLLIQNKVDGDGSVLKRKWPLRIDIPSTAGLGGFKLDTPRGEDRLDEVVVEGESYSVYCKRGRRGCVMEDRYSAVVDINGDSSRALFGVFDGHGGAKAAEFAAKNLGNNIVREFSRRCEEDVESSIRNGYLTTDAEFLKEDHGGGACCVTALIRNGDLVVSNAGDCRAVMCLGGAAEALTSDHRPSRKDEKERIEALGGYVDCYPGVWRIQGSLAVSRGIGDRTYKQWVTAEPETRVVKINPECEFLILASDGLWDKVSNQEAVDIVRPLCVGVDKPEPFSACKKLAELSVRRGSMDDISVMVIHLGRFVL